MSGPVCYLFPADVFGCGYYRLILAGNHLAQQGYQIRIIPPRSPGSIQIMPDPRDGSVFAAGAPRDADVLVFQRVTFAPIVEAIRKFRERGIAVVVDVDDDLDRIDPRNPAWGMLHPQAGTGQSWVTAEAACTAATLVTVSTPALLDKYAPRGNGVVLPNCVPEGLLTIPRFDSPVFGWGGSLHSHPGDLAVMGDAAARLMREGHQMRVVGPIDGIRQALQLPWEPDATGPLQINDWPAGLSTLGCGVAPLADTIFNRAKSRLKMIEMSALGVPGVFSPRSDYMQLHQQSGIGIPAARPKDWYRELKKLTTDDRYRRQLSAEHRAAAAAYTIEANSWRWMQAWDDALRLQRKGATSVFGFGAPRTAGHDIPHAPHI